MRTLKISFVSLIALSLVVQLQASELYETLALNTMPVSRGSSESINSTVQVLKPLPIDGYAKLGEKIEYPEIARLMGLEPLMVVQTHIDANGEILGCRIVEGPKKIGFEEAIFGAIRNTKWSPAIYDGIAAPSILEIKIQFKQ